MYERDSTARHSSTVKTMKMNPKIPERKKTPAPSRVIMSCLIGTPYTGQKEKKIKIEQQSFSLSLVRRPPLSRPSRNRFGPGKAFLPPCHSEPRRPLHVKPVAALVRQLDKVGAQNAWLSQRFLISPQKYATLEFYFPYPNDPYILVHSITGTTPGGQTEPIHASLMSRGIRDA